MSRIIIKQPGQPDMWVKDIDKLTGEVTFTTSPSEAYNRDGSFYCNSEVKSLKNPMLYDQEKYPQLQYAQVEGGY